MTTADRPRHASDDTFIVRLDEDGEGARLAVKDCIDVAGVPSTCGSALIASTTRPATADAPCVANARAAGVRIVGKTNQHELMFGVTGINPWYGTPTNPLAPTLVPGGSSSGSAVAVATGAADIAFGTDTAGSCRIPAACCGVVGLKTSWGRIPVDGVMPLAPSFDVVGALARDVEGVALGMQLLEPGFVVATSAAPRIGRVAVDADPSIDEAISSALAASGLPVEEADVGDWAQASVAVA